MLPRLFRRVVGAVQPQIEIAEKQNCSERTVRRLLDRIRARWESELESSLSQ
jgi:DNA-directed RNA polymerase specialized sigma24 family protein